MSWEDTSPGREQVTKVTKVPGTQDPSADYKAFWVWLRQQGKDLYQGKELGFTAEDVTAWFELWKGARDQGATPTPDVIHEGNATDVTNQLVVTGKAAHLVGLGQPAPGAAEEHQGRAGRGRLPG